MSEEEEAKRRRQLEESNATALFDDGLQMCVVFSLVLRIRFGCGCRYGMLTNNVRRLDRQPTQNLVDVGWNQQQQPLQPQYTSFNVSLRNALFKPLLRRRERAIRLR
jgi:hypothetical protein